jgi:hypothetical protein
MQANGSRDKGEIMSAQPELAIATVRRPEMEPVESVTPMSILQMAISQGADIEKLTKLMELKEKWDAMEARKAFVQAMADFKKEDIFIAKDKENKQYGSRYTSIGELVNTVTPLLAKHGLSAEWTPDQSSGIRVGCTITHALGHSGDTKWMTVPEDSSGAKNPIQKIKSSFTYARILTFEMACGLASQEGNLDDDGNGFDDTTQADRAKARNERAMGSTPPEVGTPISITPEQKERLLAALKANKKKAAELYAFLDLKVGSAIPASRFQEALTWTGSTAPSLEMPKKVFEAFQILEWTEFEVNTFIEKHESRWDDILKSLNQMIDAENEREQ